MQEPSIDTDKLSYEIFSILESKFLFGYNNLDAYVPEPLLAVAPPPLPPAADGILCNNQTPDAELSTVKNGQGKICILSIDGGGGGGIMGGVLAGRALAHLENALQRLSGNPDGRICDFFDVAAGSGVGGVLAAMLFATKDGRRPLYRAEDAWRFLIEKSADSGSSTSGGGKLLRRLITGGGRSSAGTVGERAVKEAFGRSMTLKETLKPVLIPCYDMCSAAPFLFSRADALESDSFNFGIWDICHATLAEAGLDEAAVMRSVDGKTRVKGADSGLAGMSNPTAAAITHVLHNKEEFPCVRGVEDLIVVSIGAGPSPVSTGGIEHEELKRLKGKKWVRPIARIAADNSAELVDQAVSMAFGQRSGTNYARIQARGCGQARFGPNEDKDTSPNTVKKMVALAEDMLKQKNVESVLFGGKRMGEKSNGEKLDWFAGQIVEEHQKRSYRIAPTVAIKQAPSPKKN